MLSRGDYLVAIRENRRRPIRASSREALGQAALWSQAPILATSFVATNMHGAWVGTWGFHHPCGHIMAEFSTLGFTYTIPEMTGKLGIMKDGAGAAGEENSWGIRAHLLLPLNKL